MSSFFSFWERWRLDKNFPIYFYFGFSVFLLVTVLGFYRLFHSLGVTVETGGKVVKVDSKAQRVGELLEEQGIALGVHDRVYPGLEEPLEEDLHILIQRAVPVIITTDTGSIRHYTHATTVYGAFQELGVPLTGAFVVEPGLGAGISPGKEICFFRRAEVVEVFEESIPYLVEKKSDGDLTKGKQCVLQEGAAGKKELRFRVVYAGGKELLRKMIAEDVLQQPVSQIVAVGTKSSLPPPPPMKLASRGGRTEGQASWYGAEFHGKRTSSGEIYDQNAYTAAHCYLPFGTYVKVTYLRTGKSVTVRINDRGPHISGRIIDLSRASAEAIGLRPHGVGQVSLEIME